jgi:hypothetical protein
MKQTASNPAHIPSTSFQSGNRTYSKFSNFGEYLFYSYANLQMLCYAIGAGKKKYDRTCYMVRAKAFKAYKEGAWNIHDLMENNIAKIKGNNHCWYCGKQLTAAQLTKDHVFARSKGGNNDMDNIIMVCKSCNSSKGNMDLFKWYCEVRGEFPPVSILAHYLKNIYLYSIEHQLMDKQAEELDVMDLPFDWQYIPIKYPEPENFR